MGAVSVKLVALYVYINVKPKDNTDMFDSVCTNVRIIILRIWSKQFFSHPL